VDVKYIKRISKMIIMFFRAEELRDRIVHIERYLDGKTTYMWPEATGNPWQDKWLKEYLNILRGEYYAQRKLRIDDFNQKRSLK
jgi:hypothetical protein